MANNPQNPQNEQQKAQKSEQGRFADQKSDQKPGQDADRERTPQERERYAQQQNAGREDSMVGKDTDGDGKVVKPGQKPGQSHGQGLPENKKQ